jgi:tRNA(Ile)-lysidine synthase
MRVFLDASRANMPLTVRSRLPGDRFHPLGAPGSRRLKEFMVDAHVARHRRDTVPLVVSASAEIVWVVGHRIADGARLTGPCERVLRLEALPLSGAEGPPEESG